MSLAHNINIGIFPDLEGIEKWDDEWLLPARDDDLITHNHMVSQRQEVGATHQLREWMRERENEWDREKVGESEIESEKVWDKEWERSERAN